MGKFLNMMLWAATAFLAASCQLDFIDEDNTLCRTSWQEESVSTFNMDGTLAGFEDRTAQPAFVSFFYTGTWAFDYDGGMAAEYGIWGTEVVPKNGATFEVILISDFPGHFVKKGHSGEKYAFTIKPSGDTLEILHKHVDASEYTVTRFLRSTHRVTVPTNTLKTN